MEVSSAVQAQSTSGILEASWRPITDAAVLLSCRKFTNAQFREILLVALVDLVHRQIFLTYCVEAALHLQMIFYQVGNERTGRGGLECRIGLLTVRNFRKRAFRNTSTIRAVVDKGKAPIRGRNYGRGNAPPVGQAA